MRDTLRLFAVLAAVSVFAPAVSSATEVSGTVFEDRNADGEFNPPEPGVAGWVVYLDADADGVLDNPSGAGTCTAQATERCVITDASGAFRFTGLSAGTVLVRIVPQPEWALTTDAAVGPLLAGDDTVISGALFGVFRLGIANGTVFVDADGNGFRELSEPPLPGTTVFIDADFDDVFDPGEISANSGEDGTYAVDGLTLGTHSLFVRNRCGFIQTLPPPPTLRYVLTDTESGQVIDGRDVGLQPPAILPGDGSGDGIVTAADLVAVAQALNTFPGVNGTDANRDGGVNGADLLATATNMFDCAGIAVPVGVPMATATATSTAAATSTATLSATSGGASPTASATSPPPTRRRPSGDIHRDRRADCRRECHGDTVRNRRRPGEPDGDAQRHRDADRDVDHRRLGIAERIRDRDRPPTSTRTDHSHTRTRRRGDATRTATVTVTSTVTPGVPPTSTVTRTPPACRLRARPPAR